MNNDQRLQQLKHWLSQHFNSDQSTECFRLTVASADASFRRYFRVHYNSSTMIAMDAPPDKEDCAPFVKIAKRLFNASIHAPEILAENHDQGFLLLSDLGDTQYLSVLNEDSANALYKDAIDTIIKIQGVSTENLPGYDRALLHTEMQLFVDWFLQQHLGLTLTDEQLKNLELSFECLIESALQQPQFFVHRDYHSRNLMQINENNPGVIDFQDAVTGAVTYDLASLLKDCYISWPRQQVENWVDYYLQQSYEKKLIDRSFTLDDVLLWFDLMAAQRHLKAIGIFARLNIRDNKPGYIKDIPRTFAYLIDSCERYPLLIPLKSVLQELNIAEKLGLEWKPLP